MKNPLQVLCWCGVALLAGCQADGTGSIFGAEPAVVLSSNELNMLGRQDMDAGNFGLAERHFREAVEKNADDGASWVGLAAAYDNLGRFELADRAYDQAVRIEGDSLPILNNIAYSRFLRGDRTGALERIRRALKLYPGSPVLLNNLHLVKTGERPNRAVAP